jgi:hypothetical protein
MGSGVVIYVPSFIKIGSGIQKLIGGYRDKQTAWRSHKPAFSFQNKGSRLKIIGKCFLLTSSLAYSSTSAFLRNVG